MSKAALSFSDIAVFARAIIASLTEAVSSYAFRTCQLGVGSAMCYSFAAGIPEDNQRIHRIKR